MFSFIDLLEPAGHQQRFGYGITKLNNTGVPFWYKQNLYVPATSDTGIGRPRTELYLFQGPVWTKCPNRLQKTNLCCTKILNYKIIKFVLSSTGTTYLSLNTEGSGSGMAKCCVCGSVLRSRPIVARLMLRPQLRTVPISQNNFFFINAHLIKTYK